LKVDVSTTSRIGLLEKTPLCAYFIVKYIIIPTHHQLHLKLGYSKSCQIPRTKPSGCKAQQRNSPFVRRRSALATRLRPAISWPSRTSGHSARKDDASARTPGEIRHPRNDLNKGDVGCYHIWKERRCARLGIDIESIGSKRGEHAAGPSCCTGITRAIGGDPQEWQSIALNQN
jgi:hypothetical protein